MRHLWGQPTRCLSECHIGYDLKSYVDAGRLAPIDDVWAAINGDEVFSEGLKENGKFDGHAYAVPLQYSYFEPYLV